ncbi:hypothetical protein [Sulfolobus polyhedral virus 1]|uniref:Uncharacterized protein n=1 Tax=Sulfolobus polyhedral virus 1 TaxID=1982658 RepID=A0A1W6I137_SPV1|nr:hypothetical protein DT302_gp01 [Sulfolobus polyhedral virus 1]ARM37783.1 hypothetical protein [Sulfolobus polyhedral virus 1]
MSEPKQNPPDWFVYMQNEKYNKKLNILAKKFEQTQKELAELKSQLSKLNNIDTITNVLAQIAEKSKEIDVLAKEIEEVKAKTSHNHNWEYLDDKIKCKDCNYSVELPPQYKKLQTADDLFKYLFSPYKYNGKTYNSVLEVDEYFKRFIEQMKGLGFDVNVRDGEVRIRKKK